MMSHLPSVIIQLISHLGYFGVFFLMLLESLLLPIPSEITMPFAGFLSQGGHLNFWIVVLAGAFGNLGGSLIAYAIGFYLEETVILSLIQKYGKYILLSPHEYERAMKWFKKYGNSVTFFSRLLPAVRTFISLPAGLAEMNLTTFSFFTFAGSFIWSALLTWIGFSLGKNWNSWEPYFRKFQIGIIILVVIGILLYVNRHFKIVSFGKKKH